MKFGLKFSQPLVWIYLQRDHWHVSRVVLVINRTIRRQLIIFIKAYHINFTLHRSYIIALAAPTSWSALSCENYIFHHRISLERGNDIGTLQFLYFAFPEKNCIPLLRISIFLKLTPTDFQSILSWPPRIFHFFALTPLEILVFPSNFDIPIITKNFFWKSPFHYIFFTKSKRSCCTQWNSPLFIQATIKQYL